MIVPEQSRAPRRGMIGEIGLLTSDLTKCTRSRFGSNSRGDSRMRYGSAVSFLLPLLILSMVPVSLGSSEAPTPAPTKDKTITFTDVSFSLTSGCEVLTSETWYNANHIRLGNCKNATWEATVNLGGSAMITKICVYTQEDENTNRDQADDMKLYVDSVLQATHYNDDDTTTCVDLTPTASTTLQITATSSKTRYDDHMKLKKSASYVEVEYYPTPAPTRVPTVLPTPAPTNLPTKFPTALPTALPTPLPTPLPTLTPAPTVTPLPTPVAVTYMEAQSCGYSASGGSSWLVTSPQQETYSVSRGLGLVIFSRWESVESSTTYDTYDSSSESDALLTALRSVATGRLIVLVVWDEASEKLGSDVQTYLESDFGATHITDMGFRAPYILISFKGESSPEYEDVGSEEDTECLTASWWFPTLSPTPLPTGLPTKLPTPLPTKLPTPLPSKIPTPLPTDLPTADDSRGTIYKLDLSSFLVDPEPSTPDSPNRKRILSCGKGCTSGPTPLPTTPLPMSSPTKLPTRLPSSMPTPLALPSPTKLPTSSMPTPLPVPFPTGLPTGSPSSMPTPLPVPFPTGLPTGLPSPRPSPLPTPLPTGLPTRVPSPRPSPLPTPLPTGLPTRVPSSVPTALPSPLPTSLPTKLPSSLPTAIPTALPSPLPTSLPSALPTSLPTNLPTPLPSALPTPLPTSLPTPLPSPFPSPLPTNAPTPLPSPIPTYGPTPLPSAAPTPVPSPWPTPLPIPAPTAWPSSLPTSAPTEVPTGTPTANPSPVPSSAPSPQPSLPPTPAPTPAPTTPLPTSLPTALPSPIPTYAPTPLPSSEPTPGPTTPAPTTPSPTSVTCMNGALDSSETDVDCGGPDCAKCSDGLGCSMNADCFSEICGSPGIVGACSSNCFCVTTEVPSRLPTPVPTSLPTPKPTYSPPVATEVVVGGSNSTSEVNPAKKLVLTPKFSSADPKTTLEWAASGLGQVDFHLVYRVTALTNPASTVPGPVVIKADVLRPGEMYNFRFTLRNSDGATDVAAINVTVAEPPGGGFLAVEPWNGTAVTQNFVLSAANWTDDPSSFPLAYAFFYEMADGRDVLIKSASPTPNASTRLPLGYGTEYLIPLVVQVIDTTEASAKVNITARSLPPADTSAAVNSVLEDTSALLDSDEEITEDAMTSGLVSIQTGASVLSAATSNDDGTTDDDGSSSSSSSTDALVSNLLNVVSSMVSNAPVTASTVEASLVCVEALTSLSPETVSETDRDNTMNTISYLVNASASSLGTMSTTAASSVVTGVSNVIEAGFFSPSSSGRRLSAAASTSVASTLMNLNTLMTSDLAVGEDPVEFSTTNVAMTNAKLSGSYLSSGGGFTVVPPVADAQSSFATQPSYSLPADMFDAIGVDGSEELSLASISYGQNPHDDGSLANNSVISSLTVNGKQVGNLSTPIVMEMSLPSGVAVTIDDAGRRRLEEVSYMRQVHELNCSKARIELAAEVFNQMDYDRFQYCNGGASPEAMVYPMNTTLNKTVYCDLTGESFNMVCGNASGVLTLTCPYQYTGASCLYWDDATSAWSSEGCTYWKRNEETGTAVCNCTHLTDFTVQNYIVDESEASSFADTAAGIADLDFDDVAKNPGLFVSMVSAWVFAMALFVRDRRLNRERAADLYFSDENKWRVKYCLSALQGKPLRDANIPIEDVRQNKVTDLEVQVALQTKVDENKKISKNFCRDMVNEMSLFSLLFPGWWDVEGAAARSLLILGRLVTFLFTMCWSVPAPYLCDDTPGSSPGSSFLTFPDVTNKYVLLDFVLQNTGTLIFNTILTVPALYIITVWFQQNTDLFKLAQLHVEWVQEKLHIVTSVKEFDVADNNALMEGRQLLNSLEFILRQQLKILRRRRFFAWSRLVDKIPEGFNIRYAEASLAYVLAVQSRFKKNSVARQAILNMKRGAVKPVIGGADGDAVELNRAGQNAIRRMKKRTHLEDDAAPQIDLVEVDGRLQSAALIHERLKPHFALRERITKMIQSNEKDSKMYKWCKLQAYQYYLVTDPAVDIWINHAHVKPLKLQQIAMTVVAVLYLLFCTLFVFVYAARYSDNNIIRSILLGLASSEVVGSFVMAPPYILLETALLPFLAVLLVAHEVKHELRKMKEAQNQHISSAVSNTRKSRANQIIHQAGEKLGAALGRSVRARADRGGNAGTAVAEEKSEEAAEPLPEALSQMTIDEMHAALAELDDMPALPMLDMELMGGSVTEELPIFARQAPGGMAGGIDQVLALDFLSTLDQMVPLDDLGGLGGTNLDSNDLLLDPSLLMPEFVSAPQELDDEHPRELETLSQEIDVHADRLVPFSTPAVEPEDTTMREIERITKEHERAALMLQEEFDARRVLKSRQLQERLDSRGSSRGASRGGSRHILDVPTTTPRNVANFFGDIPSPSTANHGTNDAFQIGIASESRGESPTEAFSPRKGESELPEASSPCVALDVDPVPDFTLVSSALGFEPTIEDESVVDTMQASGEMSDDEHAAANETSLMALEADHSMFIGLDVDGDHITLVGYGDGDDGLIAGLGVEDDFNPGPPISKEDGDTSEDGQLETRKGESTEEHLQPSMPPRRTGSGPGRGGRQYTSHRPVSGSS